jgi:FkbM family methyltransferase
VNLASIKQRLRAGALTAMASRGIELHRTSGVRRTLPAVLAHYRRRGLSPATVIDVGVGPGTPELYQAFPDAKLLLVEPLEEWRSHLEQVQRERQAEVVTAAAGACAGEIELAVHRVPACSSMVGRRRGEDADPTRRVVEMVRLDDVVEHRGLTGPFVVKVDVEGGELEVLAGALELLRTTELVLLEVSLFELVAGAPQFHDVVIWMHDHGFVVSDLYNGHNRLLDGALAQLDVAFLPEGGRFRREQAYATPAQADALYRAWGH